MSHIAFRTPADWRRAVDRVRAHLHAGGVVAHPTETVYGVGCRAATADIEAVAALKGRGSDVPMLVLVSSPIMIERWHLALTDAARRLAEAFWPGPLTLILAAPPDGIPPPLIGPSGGVGVRWTGHAGMAWLIEELDAPLISTSANRAGEPPASDPDALADTFRDAVTNGSLLVLDGGRLEGLPSTVVDCTSEEPRVVRAGAIPLDALRLTGSVTL